MRPTTYVKGDWAVVCDRCGREQLASQLQQEWDGLKVCVECWEPRQPQDFVRGVADIQAPPWTRPESKDSFIIEDQSGHYGPLVFSEDETTPTGDVGRQQLRLDQPELSDWDPHNPLLYTVDNTVTVVVDKDIRID